MEFLSGIVFLTALASGTGALAYAVAAITCVAAFRPSSDTVTCGGRRRGGSGVPVTVLKPLCGYDPGLYENLRSFCEQDYQDYQVVFGVLAPDDSAIAVARRLIANLPDRDLELVIGDPPPAIGADGRNRKVVNLASMVRAAKHEVIVIADSDIRVGRGYLAAVTAPLSDPTVGAVTCLYTARPVDGGLLSVLASLSINDWFLPSVLVGHALGDTRFCLGGTVALRRNVLRHIGGFEALSAYLADDYMLGTLVSERGYEVRLSRYVVETVVLEPDLASLFRHELRWARTIRAARPVGYFFSYLTFTVPVCAVAAFAMVLTAGRYGTALGLVVLAVLLRLGRHRIVRSRVAIRGPDAPYWLMLLRDFLSLALWAAAYLSRTVHWRGRDFVVQADGRLLPTTAGGPPVEGARPLVKDDAPSWR